MQRWYTFIYAILFPVFKILRPSRAIGLENLPEGGALICPNHTKAVDPFFVVFSFGLKNRMSGMAKIEIMRIPVIGALLKKAGIFGIDRGKADVGAIKTAMKRLKDGEKLLMFPEGTRVKEGEEGDHEAKNGAAMLALRTGVPIVPVYIPRKKNWFRPTTVVVGEPYRPQIAGKKATQEEYNAISAEMMRRIFALGEQVKG